MIKTKIKQNHSTYFLIGKPGLVEMIRAFPYEESLMTHFHFIESLSKQIRFINKWGTHFYQDFWQKSDIEDAEGLTK